MIGSDAPVQCSSAGCSSPAAWRVNWRNPRIHAADRVKVWMGHRPSTPDGMPVIGRARATGDLVYAFGHGHVGLVAGPRTGRLVAQLVAGRDTEVPVEPFDPGRFR